MAEDFVSVSHLTKRFGDLTVLSDISFSVRKGEFLCVVGPTGCGKTTFLSCLTGAYGVDSGSILLDGEKVDLTPKEYELLFYLVKNKNLALSRDKLLQDIWGYDFFGDDRTIDTHIKNLRNNLGPYRDYIVTLRGVGYKFEVDQQ